MNYKHFVGIDVSKKWLDFTLVVNNQQVFHQQLENDSKAIIHFLSLLKRRINFTVQNTVFCLEHTGIYNNYLLDIFAKKGLNVSLQSGLQIKYSSGMQRGKNDKVDSLRIALYAYKNREGLKLWTPKRQVLVKLKQLTALRKRLVCIRKQLKVPLMESLAFVEKSVAKKTSSLCKHTLNAIDKDIKAVEKEIAAIIKQDPELNRLFNIITSVNGVGSNVATEIMITTNEFKDINCPKKYACYSSVAPFEHQSGSSIRGKTRISNMGNKTIKTLLHMASLTSILHNPELKEYYQRKVEQGKNKMLVLNAIRNKLIHRIFSCVNQNRFYEENYSTNVN